MARLDAMKLPRWLVILMVTTSILGVLAAAGWWWVTWPERTAREFVHRLDKTDINKNDQSWRDMVPGGGDRTGFKRLLSLYPSAADEGGTIVRLRPRSVGEIVSGKQVFFFSSDNFGFTAERGIIHGLRFYEDTSEDNVRRLDLYRFATAKASRRVQDEGIYLPDGRIVKPIGHRALIW